MAWTRPATSLGNTPSIFQAKLAQGNLSLPPMAMPMPPPLGHEDTERCFVDLEKGGNGMWDEVSRDRPLGETWMAGVKDNVEVSALTIPGTHDSCAYTSAWPFIQTQKMDIMTQLNAGIRYFDLRCGLRNDELEMVHGTALLGLTLHIVLDTMYLWLLSHKSEALVVQLKQDRGPEKSTVHFAHAVWKCISQSPVRWRTANTNPKLGELRGRIQLLRRFTGPTLDAYGIDVTQWPDNSLKPFTIQTRHNVQVTIQDHYNFSEPQGLPAVVAQKGRDVVNLLNHAAANTEKDHWFINFTSAYEFNLWYQLTPKEIAVGGWWGFKWEAGMNARLRGYLTQQTEIRRYGIVTMDFPESGADGLIEALVRLNFKQKPRSLGSFWLIVSMAMFVVLLLAALMLLLHLCRESICTFHGQL